MATKFDLINAVNESLTRSGKLNKLKAEMRAEVMKVLDSSSSVTKPEIPKETSLACELVRDFLLWNGFQYTASTLVADSKIINTCAFQFEGLSPVYRFSIFKVCFGLGTPGLDSYLSLLCISSLVQHESSASDHVAATQAVLLRIYHDLGISIFYQDSNPDLLVNGGLAYCESNASRVLDLVAPKVGLGPYV
uniref:LisH domain-containing protein n=1 Tax=Timema monikensis TaxID=170555 RepID=A0A7R9HVH0_9NEOP|nr:unnamed protein product [Timema monikensis]